MEPVPTDVHVRILRGRLLVGCVCIHMYAYICVYVRIYVYVYVCVYICICQEVCFLIPYVILTEPCLIFLIMPSPFYVLISWTRI